MLLDSGVGYVLFCFFEKQNIIDLKKSVGQNFVIFFGFCHSWARVPTN